MVESLMLSTSGDGLERIIFWKETLLVLRADLLDCVVSFSLYQAKAILS